jgi:PadR family transcriptional regulator, regulatory protein AphA
MDVRTQCLGLLMRGPASGYEIKKLVEEGPFCHFLQASFAAIYPALSRLTQEGLVTVSSCRQSNRPDKKVYEITEQGRAAFFDTIAGPLEDDSFRSPWFVAMYFAEQLPQTRIGELIASRIASCENLLSKIDRDAADTTGARFVAGLGAHLLNAEISYLRANGGQLAAGPSATKHRKPHARQTNAAAEPLEL